MSNITRPCGLLSLLMLLSAATLAFGSAGCTARADDPAMADPPPAKAPAAMPVSRISAGVYYLIARSASGGRLAIPWEQAAQTSGEVVCAPADASPGQRWYVAPDPERPGRYTIAADVGRVRFLQPLADPGPLPLAKQGPATPAAPGAPTAPGMGINDPGRPIGYGPRWDTGYQSWTLSRAPGAEGFWTVTNDGSRLLLELREDQPGKVWQQTPTGRLNQQWALKRVE